MQVACTLTKMRQLINVVQAGYNKKKRPQTAPEIGYYKIFLPKKCCLKLEWTAPKSGAVTIPEGI